MWLYSMSKWNKSATILHKWTTQEALTKWEMKKSLFYWLKRMKKLNDNWATTKILLKLQEWHDIKDESRTTSESNELKRELWRDERRAKIIWWWKRIWECETIYHMELAYQYKSYLQWVKMMQEFVLREIWKTFPLRYKVWCFNSQTTKIPGWCFHYVFESVSLFYSQELNLTREK
jgi:hypothetical protein